MSFGFLSNAQDIYQKYGIYRSPFRVLINHVSWNISSGYGYTQYNHDLTGLFLVASRESGQLFVRFYERNNAGEIIVPETLQGFSNWLNDPRIGPDLDLDVNTAIPWRYLPEPINNINLVGNQFALGDTVAWRGIANSVPVTASMHVEFKNFKIGAGYTFEPQWMLDLQTVNPASTIPNYQPNFSYTPFHRAFGIFGYRFYEYWDYAAVADLQVGKVWYGPVFSPELVKGTVNLNLGVTFEHHWSEYFALTLRPSFDYKQYTLTLPDNTNILHRHNSFHLQFGVSIKIPEIPRSPIDTDHVQLKHVITDPISGQLMEVRGQPFWKKQNPKVGENHRKLWRYKWRNKRKMHPY